MVGVGEFCSEAGFVKFGLLVVTLTVAVMLLNASVLPNNVTETDFFAPFFIS